MNYKERENDWASKEIEMFVNTTSGAKNKGFGGEESGAKNNLFLMTTYLFILMIYETASSQWRMYTCCYRRMVFTERFKQPL